MSSTETVYPVNSSSQKLTILINSALLLVSTIYSIPLCSKIDCCMGFDSYTGSFGNISRILLSLKNKFLFLITNSLLILFS